MSKTLAIKAYTYILSYFVSSGLKIQIQSNSNLRLSWHFYET